MPFMLGSFAGGLWNGAASAMSMARQYQQFQVSKMAMDAADQTAAAIKGDQQTQAPPPTPTQTQPDGTTTSPDGTTTTPSPDTTTTAPVVPVRKENLPAPKSASKPAIGPQGKEVKPQKVEPSSPDTNVAGQAGAVGTQSGAATGAVNPLVVTPPAVADPTQPSPGEQTTSPQRTSGTTVAQPVTPSAPATNVAGQAGAIGTPAGPTPSAPSPIQPRTPQEELGQELPLPSGGTGGQSPGTPAILQADTGRQTDAVTSAAAQARQAALLQAQRTNQPVPIQNGNGLVANPDGSIGTPGGGFRPPPAKPGIGSMISSALGSLNPVGSAQAAEPPPPATPTQATPASTPAPAPTATPAPAPSAPTPPAPTPAASPAAGQQGPAAAPSQAQPAPPTPTPTPAILQPSQGAIRPPVTPAQPPSQATTAGATARQGGPTTVAPTGGGAVAPGQTAPSQQSETAPPKGGSSDAAFKSLPDADKQMLIRVAASYGEGYVTPVQLAAIWKREGGLQHSVQPGDGGASVGPFQIQEETARGAGAGADKLDRTTPEGGAIAATKVLAKIAIDHGLGTDSPMQNYAYMRGDGEMEHARSTGVLQPQAAMFLRQQGFTDIGGYRVGDEGHRYSDGQVWNRVMAAGHAQGPDGTLRALVETGPSGQSMSQLWRNAQAATERYLIASGHPESLPAVSDWYAMQSHQGAISNLMAADQAILGGNGALASQYLAKAHAFFPDGSYGRFGVDNSGNVFGEQLSEAINGSPIGQPMQITHDLVTRQIMQLQNPRTYVQTLQEYQLKNAQIGFQQAHASYFEQQPGIERERIAHEDVRAGIAQDAQTQREREVQAAEDERARKAQVGQTERSASTQAAEDARNAARIQGENDREKLRLQGKPDPQDVADQKQDTAAEKEGDGYFGPKSSAYQDAQMESDPGKRQTAMDGLAKGSEVYKTLRGRGGGQYSGPMSANMAGKIVSGDLKLRPGTNAKGERGYSVTDKNGKDTGMGLTGDQGDRIQGLLGLKGARPIVMSDTGQGGAARTAAIGAGASNPMVAMQGGANLAGIGQTQPLPQQTATA